LSADRANATRRELVAGGLPDDKLLRVEGLASSQLRTPEKPGDAINRRISIVILTKDAEARMLPAAAGSATSATSAPAVNESSPSPNSLPPGALPRLQISPEVTKPQVEPGG
jgi:chemotaxis protein MotB